MLSTLALSALLMGLAGSPHCLAMCGAVCAGASRSGRGRGIGGPVASVPLLWLMLGRLIGYALAGAAVAASVDLLEGWADRSAWIRPFWGMAQAGALGLGLWLLWRGRQPAWLEQIGRRAPAASADGWHPVRGPARTVGLGAAWALLPCGLLQSALVVATLAGDAAGGAVVMAAFATGSGLMLLVGPLAWSRLVQRFSAGRGGRSGITGWSANAVEARWPIRLAGAMLMAAAAWALWHGFGVAAGICKPLI